jgi:hypothetical protein
MDRAGLERGGMTMKKVMDSFGRLERLQEKHCSSITETKTGMVFEC